MDKNAAWEAAETTVDLLATGVTGVPLMGTAGRGVVKLARAVGEYAEEHMSPAEQRALGEYLMNEAIQPYCP